MIIRFITWLIIKSVGWDPTIPPSLEKFFKENPKSVVIFAHTTQWDFFAMLLYMYQSDVIYPRVRILMNPSFFVGLTGMLLRAFGGIPSTPIEQKSGGNVNRICEELDRTAPFIFLISPKGTRKFNTWRSGWYHIAKETRSTVIAVGFNYVKHRLEWGEGEYYNLTNLNQIEDLLKKDLASITPLKPYNCEYKLNEFSGVPKVWGWS